MIRIRPINRNTADSGAAELLEAVERKMRAVPNIISTMAHSPAVAKAYLGFGQALSTGALPTRLREQIALLVGEINGCGYCVAAHTALGMAAGLSERETCDARRGASRDENELVALGFARKIVQDRGIVTDADMEKVRQAGYSDGEIAEIVAHVAMNIFSNYFNHVAGTELDFPVPPSLKAA